MRTGSLFRFSAAIILGIAIIDSLNAQEHFQPVEETGSFSTIVIQSASINDAQPQIGDEIAVFDETLCVGAVVFQGTFPLSCPGILRYQLPDGTVPPGREPGSP